MHRLLALVVALIIYGSFYPWQFDFSHQWRTPLSDWPFMSGRSALRDIIVNVIIYVPMGLLAHVTLRNRTNSVTAALGAVALGLALSTVIEIAQLYAPRRFSSVLDVLCNGAGAALGVALAMLFGETLRRAHMRVDRTSLLHPSKSLFLIYVFVGYQLYPLFPTTSLTVLGAKFDALMQGSSLSPGDLLIYFCEWLAAGKLVQMVVGTRRTQSLMPFLLLSIPAKLFISQRLFSFGELAAAAAACAAWRFDIGRTSERALLPALALAIAIVGYGLAPTSHETTGGTFSWTPFGGLLTSEWRAGLFVLIRKTFWYGGLLLILREASWRARTATLVVAAGLAIIEIAQLYVPGHISEITDPLFALMLGFALFGRTTDSVSANAAPLPDRAA